MAAFWLGSKFNYHTTVLEYMNGGWAALFTSASCGELSICVDFVAWQHGPFSAQDSRPRTTSEILLIRIKHRLPKSGRGLVPPGTGTREYSSTIHVALEARYLALWRLSCVICL